VSIPGERLFDHFDGGGPDGYQCVEFVASASVAHVRLGRTSTQPTEQNANLP
jgi:hypothetical protein